MNRGKKIVIPAIIIVLVVVVAVIVFVLIGVNDKKGKDSNSTIKFNDEDNTANVVQDDEGESEPEIADGVEDFQKEAVEKFLAGYMDEDDMEDFLEDCIDTKAYLAYGNVNGDDKKFLEEYEAIEDDSDEVAQVTDSFKKCPQMFKFVMMLLDSMTNSSSEFNNAFSDIMNNTTNDIGNDVRNNVTNTTDDEVENDITNTTDNEIANNTVSDEDEEMPEFSDEDKKMRLVRIDEPEESSDDSEITSVVFTVSFLQQEAKLKMVFYGDVVIYICDEDGVSILESSFNDELSTDSNDLDSGSDNISNEVE